MKTTLLAVLALMAGPLAAEDHAATKAKPIDYAADLAQVPATDPAPTVIIAPIAAMAGVHPRLLFTHDEAVALQKTVAGDSLLKDTLADVIRAVGQWPFPAQHPDVVGADDTPAIWKSGGTYPGLAYAYHVGGSDAAKQKMIGILTTMADEPYWSDAAELDCSMGAGNNLLMVGILFDAVANDLAPDLRAKIAAKMLVEVRRMWYLGHQGRSVGTIKYWQNDPLNNHRWHRDAGMAACLGALAGEPGIECGYLLEQFRGEMDLIAQWLPPDGDSHEGAGYQAFGYLRLALAMRMMDRVFGTTYQTSPGLRHAWEQQIYWSAPGRSGNMSFGDDSNDDGGGYNWDDAGFFAGPLLSRDADAQAALRWHMDVRRQRAKKAGFLPWDLLTFYDPALSGGDLKRLPTRHLSTDLGAASMRDTWDPAAVALTFKCGPYGGNTLNAFAMRSGTWSYVNVAHDDPDANAFALGTAGDLVFHPGTYSMPKWTESNSTILVDGKGQVNEGSAYTQPVKNTDMRTLSFITGWKAGDGGRSIVEGEAGKAYAGKLQRYRRTAVYLPGDYILILDDIVGDAPHAITWLGVTGSGTIVDAQAGTATATGAAGKSMGVQVRSDVPLVAEVKPYVVKARWGDLKVEQIRFTGQGAAMHIACVIDAWGRHAHVALAGKDQEHSVTVTMDGHVDAWTWHDAVGEHAPSGLEGKRDGAALLALTAGDAVTAGK